MTKILLINPLLKPPFSLTKREFNIPLGPLYVGSYLYQKEYEVKVMDVNNYKDPNHIFDLIKQEIKSTLCIGISAMTAQLPNAIQTCKFIRSLDTSIPIVLGGVHPTFYPQQTVKSEYVDYVIMGEGEENFLNLIKTMEKNGNLKNVNGIAFKENGHIFVTQKSNKFIDLNEFSLKYDLLDIVNNLGMNKISKFIEIPFQTSRGCPHRCTFCINSVTKNMTYRYRNTDLVLNDIEKLIEKKVKNIFFMDENFFANPKRVKEIISSIIERGLEFEWFGNIRADYFRKGYINHDLLKQIKNSGCIRVSIGAESGSQKILDMIKKDITVEDILRSAEMLSNVEIKCNYSFMIGLPKETLDDIKKTVQLMCKIKKIMPDCRFLGPQLYRPYPGSELYNECLAYGFNEPNSLEEWAIKEENEVGNICPENYPWLEVPFEIINSIIFYSLIGLSNLPDNIRYKPLKILQTIAKLRCEKNFFDFPIEKKIFDIIIRKKLPH